VKYVTQRATWQASNHSPIVHTSSRLTRIAGRRCSPTLLRELAFAIPPQFIIPDHRTGGVGVAAPFNDKALDIVNALSPDAVPRRQPIPPRPCSAADQVTRAYWQQRRVGS
jgi:hypothetical protein